VGDPTLEAKIFNAVTGIAEEELEPYATNICNLQRVILLREGRKLPEADYPPEFNFTEPLKFNARGQPVMVPGIGDEPVNATGKMLDRARYTEMLQEYYKLRGWSEEGLLPEKVDLK
jgi:aldehyde:ferredoxin oxidoreductase